MSAPSTPILPIRVTAIAVSPVARFPRGLTSGELRIGSHQYALIRDEDGSLRKEFQPGVLELAPDTEVALYYKSPFSLRRRVRKVDTRQVFARFTASERQDLSIAYDDIRVVFNFLATPIASDPAESASCADKVLTPTTLVILDNCPQFRILTIGKSGVGKSSLTGVAFGIEMAHSIDLNRGITDIDVGLESSVNTRFILHDSRGFEPGDYTYYVTVKRFIRSRQTGELRDKLHAIWFCAQIPRAGGRLLEPAAEDFFRTKKDTMGSIPLVMVYTMYDLHVNQLIMRLMQSNRELNENNITELALSEADAIVRKLHGTVELLAGEPIPYEVVSTEKNYKYTIQNLVALTYREVGTREAWDISLVPLIAQRVNSHLKIQGSIDVGRRRYWKSLRANPDFEGRPIRDCLSVIHADIVAIWNFNDPRLHLLDETFKELILEMVQEMVTSSVDLIDTTALDDGSLGPISPDSTPVMANAVTSMLPATAITSWPYKVYQRVESMQRVFMAFIVDLTHIMETLFILTTQSHEQLTRRSIKVAYDTYYGSDVKIRAHTVIQSYRDIDGRDLALEMIESLIKPELCSDSVFKSYYADVAKIRIKEQQLHQEEAW